MDKDKTKKYRREYYIKNSEDIRYQLSFYRKKIKIVYIKNCESCGKLFKTSWATKLACKPNHTLTYKHMKRQRKYKQPISKFYKEPLNLIYDQRPPGMEVDHIIPINGENVSGLHVPWNLQYLTPEENNKKSNKA